jgi:serine/threonine protein kinase/WD40 repeat protein
MPSESGSRDDTQVEQVRPETEGEVTKGATTGLRLARVGDYRVLREIGRGGMGVVYEAEQVSLGRRVALKVLPRTVASDPTSLLRFRREARAAAALHHTNIVPVFEVGQDGEVVFYAMQYIEGRGLDVVIEELRRDRDGPRESIAPPQPRPGPGSEDETIAHDGASPATASIVGPEPVRSSSSAIVPSGGAPLSHGDSSGRGLAFFRRAARIALQAAQGLAYAHARGILHRDIKPSNLLLDTAGIVWITDFGLAKAADDGLTQSGDILGTARYMAPERFRGEGNARADVYALGLTLYELLTLRPAFDSADRLRLIDQIKNATPPRPRALDPHVPRDLETVVLKAIDRDQNGRYATADALAEDLRRFLDDEPILARRTSVSERAWRWCRRRPGLVMSAAATLVVLAVGATVAAVRINAERVRADVKAADALAARNNAFSERLRADAKAKDAMTARNTSEERLVSLYVKNGSNALGREEYWTALLWYQRAWAADRANPGRDAVHRRRVAGTLGLCPQLVGLCTHASPVLDARFDPAGRRVLTRTSEAQVYLWDPFRATLAAGPLRHKDRVLHAEFSPDGTRVATCSADRTARLWDASTGAPVGPVLTHPDVVHWVTFSPDGGTLATACDDGHVRFWLLPSGILRAPMIACPAPRAVVFHPQDRLVLTGDASKLARLWDVATATPLGAPIVHDMNPGNPFDRIEVPPAFSRDGRKTLTAQGGSIFAGALQGRSLSERSVTLDFRINRVEFDAAGSRVLAVGQSSLAYVLDATDKALTTRQVIVHPREVQQGGFHPDGRIVTAASGGVIHVWDPSATRELIPPLSHFDTVTQRIQFSPDGRLLLTASLDGSARVWQIDSGPFTPRKYELDCGRAELLSPVPFGPGERAAFSPDGEHAVVINSVGPARVLSGPPAAAKKAVSLDPGEPVQFAMFSSDGRRVLTAGTRLVRVWDAETGKPAGPPILLDQPLPIALTASTVDPYVLPHQQSIQLSRDGGRLAVIDDQDTVCVYDTATARVLHGPITAQAFDESSTDPEEREERLPANRWFAGIMLSADGRMLALATHFGRGSVVHLRHIDSGRALRFLSPHGFTHCLNFSDDGRKLLVANSDTIVRTWDTQTGLPSGPSLHNRAIPQLAAFSGDGRRIAVYDVHDMLSVWDSESGDLLVPPFSRADASVPLQWVWFSRDGRLLVGQPFKGPGEVFQWDYSRLPESRSELEDLIRLLTGHELDQNDGIDRLSRSTLRQDPERFRRAWLAWRRAFAADAAAQPRSRSDARRWTLSRIESARLRLENPASGTQEEPFTDLAYLDRAIADDPTDYRLLVARGEIHARFRRWHEAGLHFERAATLRPSDITNWWRSAALAVAVGDAERQRRIFRGLMVEFGDSRVGSEVGKVAKICLLKPATASEGKKAVRILEELIPTGAAWGVLGHWLCALALADQREGDPARGLERLEQARRTPGFSGDGALRAYASLVEALCHNSLGRAEPARKALQNARSLLRANLWEHALPLPANGVWLDWLLADILYREAEARIVYDPIFPADPFVPAPTEDLGAADEAGIEPHWLALLPVATKR